MNKSIAAKLTQLSVRLEELNRLLSSETITANLDNYRKLTRERAEIAPVVELYDAYLQSERDIHTAQEMSGDAEMREFADSEIRGGKERLTQIGAELQKQLLPKDPSDERNIFLEIRAGTGGDESALFAGDLFRKVHPKPAVTRKSSPRSSVTAPTPSSNSNQAAIGCSVCLPPKPRGVFTLPPAPLR
jgi:peptide chain release factor 1